MAPRKGMIAIFFFFSLGTVLSTTGTVSAWKKADLKKLKITKSCVGCDLSGANPKGLNLTRANLKGANLQGANLSEVILVNANLTGANIKNENMGGENLNGADLENMIHNFTVSKPHYLRSRIALPRAIAGEIPLPIKDISLESKIRKLRQ